MRELKIEARGLRIHVVARRWETARQYFATTRVYVSGQIVAEESAKWVELSEQEAALGEQRWSTRGEFPEVDALYRRLNREYGRTAVEVATKVMDIARDMGEVTAHAYPGARRARFSRTAGCTCSCSPGVVLGYQARLDGVPADVYVSRVDAA